MDNYLHCFACGLLATISPEGLAKLVDGGDATDKLRVLVARHEATPQHTDGQAGWGEVNLRNSTRYASLNPVSVQKFLGREIKG